MLANPSVPRTSFRFRPKYLLFAFIGVMTAYVLVHKQRNAKLHRQWMVRSYAVALVFFEGRFITGVSGLESNPALLEAVIWACLAMSMLLADMVNQWQERRAAS